MFNPVPGSKRDYRVPFFPFIMPIDLSSALSGGISAAANGLLGLAGSAIQYNQQKKLAAQAQEYTKQNMQTQYQNSRNMVSDSPSLTAAGMRAAGLNPAFANGSMTGNLASASSSAVPSAPSNALQGLGFSALESINSTKVADAQKANLDSQTALNAAKENEINSMLPENIKKINQETENLKKSYEETDKKISLLDQEIEESLAKTNDANASADLKRQEAATLKEKLPFIVQLCKAELDTMKAQQQMYRDQGKAALMQGKAAMSQAATAKRAQEIAAKLIHAQIEVAVQEGSIKRAEADKLWLTMPDTIATICASADEKEAEARIKKWQADNPVWSRVLPQAGQVLGTAANIGMFMLK